MILDAKLDLADAYAAGAADGLVTNSLDLEEYGLADKFINAWLVMMVGSDVSITGLTEGLRLNLITSDTSTLDSGNVEVASTGIILPARMTSGAIFNVGFAHLFHRYLGVYEDVINTNQSGTLNVDIWVSPHPVLPRYHQKNLT